jgi:hypothetical protein
MAPANGLDMGIRAGYFNVLSGHFSPVETAMTVIFGAASVVGIGCFVAFKSGLSWVARIGLFVMMAVTQWATKLSARYRASLSGGAGPDCG